MPAFNHTVLMSGVDYFDDSAPINPLMTQEAAIDLTEAAAEHGCIREALQSAGVTVHTVEPPKGCQDGVFTANWALVRGDKAVMARLPNARKAEEPYAAEVLKSFGKEIIWLPEEIEKFSGQGDALPCGDVLFCGSGYRSDPDAQAFVAKTLGYERIQLKAKPWLGDDGQPVINAYSGLPDSFYYDLDLALSVLKFPTNTKKGLIAWCPAAFTPESQAVLRQFDGVDKIEVDETEAVNSLVCNLVSTGDTVIMNDGAPTFTAALESHGLKTIRLKNPELAKGGGSMRCTTLSFN
ncbi:MAG TPA: amidinotransferase [Candidatus Saccharibacteria bacterium]|nr:amidinotransferase [Candidatus Saccharibacteria bacterium]HRK94032.1 amidinotransferase [Candidatus Saccharibacteria bacterium]